MPFQYILTLLSVALLISPALCRSCPPGSYQDGTQCSKCPPGSFNSDYGASACTPCPAGTYSPFRGVVSRILCLPCTRRWTSPSGSSRCTACPRGEVGGSGRCFRCPPGTYISGRSECKPCDQFSIAPRANSHTCESCSSPWKVNAARTRCRVRLCRAGFEWTMGSCNKCTENYYSNDTMPECERCPFGSIANNPSGPNARCVQCPAGTYVTGLLAQTYTSARRGLEVCMPCPNNTTTRGLHKPLCRADGSACPPNTFLDADGDCAICDHNHIFNQSTRRCERCPAGSVAQRGAAPRCERCAPGATADARGQCICMHGRAMVGGRCELCPAGTEESYVLQRCIPCLPGYASAVSDIHCKRCPEGTVPAAPDRAKCVPATCPQGFWHGNLFPNLGEDECVSAVTGCPLGSTPRLGAAVGVCENEVGEVVCQKGLSFDGRNCEWCQRGWFLKKIEGTNRRKCRMCPRLAGSLGGGVLQCTKCTNGFEPDNYYLLDVCHCTYGRFINARGECARCPDGSVSSKFHSTSCEVCSRGFTAYLVYECRCELPRVIDAEGNCVPDDSDSPEYPH